MPYSTKGKIHYAKNGEAGTLTHNQTVLTADKFVGIAIKQKAPKVTEGILAITRIEKNEEFAVLVKGVVQVTTVASSPKGTLIYIKSDNTLTKTSSENTAFGTVVEVAGERGTPTGYMRVDLDKKV